LRKNRDVRRRKLHKGPPIFDSSIEFIQMLENQANGPVAMYNDHSSTNADESVLLNVSESH
jgi:hypothetical protein